MDEVKLTKLSRFFDEKGSVGHIFKNPELELKEIYFSSVKQGVIKGWKRHNQMTLNVAVIRGSVKFTVRYLETSHSFNLGEENYQRLTVPPGYWVAFEGISRDNVIVNCADEIHDKNEFNIAPFSCYAQDLPDW